MHHDIHRNTKKNGIPQRESVPKVSHSMLSQLYVHIIRTGIMHYALSSVCYIGVFPYIFNPCPPPGP